MISLQVSLKKATLLNTLKTHPFLAITPKTSVRSASTPMTKAMTADFFRKSFSIWGKQYLNTVCHSPLQIPETMQETWQKASE